MFSWFFDGILGNKTDKSVKKQPDKTIESKAVVSPPQKIEDEKIQATDFQNKDLTTLILDKNVSNASSSSETPLSEEEMRKRLQAAIDNALNIAILHSNNKYDDTIKTSAWGLQQPYRYHVPGEYIKYNGRNLQKSDGFANQNLVNNRWIFEPKINQWFYRPSDLANVWSSPVVHNEVRVKSLDPIDAPQFKLNQEQKYFFRRCLLAQTIRQANCGDLSRLVGKYLWEHPKGIHRIELVFLWPSFDHGFVVINREGNSPNPDTWGNAWIADAWSGEKGMIFPAKEFRQKLNEIKRFANIQREKLSPLNIGMREGQGGEDKITVEVEIKPMRDAYPSYANRPIEDYYNINNGYAIKKEDQIAHYNKFKSTVKEISQLPKTFFAERKVTSEQPLKISNSLTL